jgi:hypothetical protein
VTLRERIQAIDAIVRPTYRIVVRNKVMRLEPVMAQERRPATPKRPPGKP